MLDFPQLSSFWLHSSGRYAVLVDAAPNPDGGWIVRLGGDSSWQSWPVAGWVQCDAHGVPLSPVV